jgi:hypothetical protein
VYERERTLTECTFRVSRVSRAESTREREREREHSNRGSQTRERGVCLGGKRESSSSGRPWREMGGLMGQLQQQDRATQVGLSLALVAVVAGAAYIWYANRKPRSKHFFSFTPLSPSLP